MNDIEQLRLTLSTVKPHEGVAVVALRGECDIYEASRLEAALAEAGEVPGTCVYVDLSGLRFLDSSALHVLLKMQRALAARDAELVLVAPSVEVRRTLTVAGLDGRFEIRERLDVDAAPADAKDPSARAVSSPDLIFRSINERILELSARWVAEELHLFCECADEKCTKPVTILRTMYERVRENSSSRVLHPEHVGGGAWQVVEAENGYVVASVSSAAPAAEPGKEPAGV